MTTTSPCPKESVFAELAAGTLLDAERQELELHLDRCPACTELLGLLASLAGDGSGGSKSSVECAWWLTHDAALSMTLMVTQLFWFKVMWSPAVRCLVEGARHQTHWIRYFVFGYVVVIGATGTVVDAIGVVAAYKRRKLPSQVRLLRVVIGMATLALAPLAFVAVFHLLAARAPKGLPLGGLTHRVSRPPHSADSASNIA